MKNVTSVICLFLMTSTVLAINDKSTLDISVDAGQHPATIRLLVVDEAGRKTGQSETGQEYREIPNSFLDAAAQGSALDDEIVTGNEIIHFSVAPVPRDTFLIQLYTLANIKVSMDLTTRDKNGKSSTPIRGKLIQADLSPGEPTRFLISTDPDPEAGPTIVHAIFFDPSFLVSQRAQSCQGITLSGNTKISGKVRGGGTVSLSGNAKIVGDVTAPQVVKTGNGQVQGTVTISSAPVDCSPADLTALAGDLATSNDNNMLPATNMENGVLRLNGNDKATLPSGRYLLEGLDISGNGKLTAGGSVQMLVKGKVTVSGNGSATATDPKNLMIFTNATPANGPTVEGNTQIKGILFSPSAPVKIAGNGKIFGHVFGKGIDASGNSRIENP